MGTAFCFVLFLELKIEERVVMVVGTKNNAAAASAVTAVGSAFWHKLLAAKADRSRSAITRFHMDTRKINKLHSAFFDSGW